MKKWFKVFPVLLAIFALLVAGIACGGGSSDNGNDSGNDSPTEAVDNGNDGSDNGNDGSDNGNDGSDNGNDGSDNGGDDQEAIEGLLDEFMTALSEKDYDKAYELFPADFDGESSAERLGQWADDNKIFPTSWTFGEIEVDNDESIVELDVTWEDPDDDDPMFITFTNDNGWYISHVDFEKP